MFECRIRSNEFPQDGEVVIGKIASMDDNVVNIELIEYGNIKGLVLNNEISKKRVKSVSQVTKVGATEICQVLKVDKQRKHIDLSLKKVADKEKSECRERFNKNKLAYQIMLRAAKLAEIPVKDLYEKWGYQKEEQYGTLQQYFSEAKDNFEDLLKEPYGECFKKVIEEQFKASTFKVRIDVDVKSPNGGVDKIKEVFNLAMEVDPSLEITLLRSPTYSIVKVGENKEEAFAIVNKAAQAVKEAIESSGGFYSEVSASKVYGEKSRHTLLEGAKAVDVDEDESESGFSDDLSG